MFEYLLKFVILGDGFVGKTTTSERITNNVFHDIYKVTIGVNVNKKVMVKDGIPLLISFFDTGGQHFFVNLIDTFITNSIGAIIMFDVTNRKSFENLDKWFNFIKFTKNIMPIIIVGNKIDLNSKRVVSKEEGLQYAERMSKEWMYNESEKHLLYRGKNIPIKYVETSAKTSYESVNDMVDLLIDTVFEFIKTDNNPFAGIL